MYKFPRCQVVPEPNQEVSFLIDGSERLRWHGGLNAPRPFFYPLVGPSGTPLTRIGHPGAPNHDHHRSIWFGHAKVLGIDFWSENTKARIRQQSWLCYGDGDAGAHMAVRLGWYDGHEPKELLTQELVVEVRPAEKGETLVELQATFTPTAETLELQQTNFGLLAVRVAKNLSAYFGGGEIRDSRGRVGEPAIFGQPAEWCDYSGPVPGGETEGITYFDHPGNPGFPTRWHVREDGWMGASLCFSGPVTMSKTSPLCVRYLLHAHRGPPDRDRAAALLAEFTRAPRFEVLKATVKHNQFQARRMESK